MASSPTAEVDYGSVNRAREAGDSPGILVVFLAPAVLIYTLFMIYPAGRLAAAQPLRAGRATARASPARRTTSRLLTDNNWAPRFWNAFQNNLVFFAVHMLVQNPIGLLLAALLEPRGLRGRAVYRTLIFTPTLLSVVIIGFIWQLILNPLWGIAQGALAGHRPRRSSSSRGSACRRPR